LPRPDKSGLAMTGNVWILAFGIYGMGLPRTFQVLAITLVVWAGTSPAPTH